MVKSHWNEEWKEIKFEEGALKKRYAVSNYGRLISFIDKIHLPGNHQCANNQDLSNGKLRVIANLQISF